MAKKATAVSPRETTVFSSRAFCGGCERDVRGAIFRRGLGSGTASFQRFRRLAKRGVFKRVFNALSDDPDFEYVFVDGTIVQAHQKASGAKGGPRNRVLAVLAGV